MKLTASDFYGHPAIFLEGKKRGERLRVDGYRSPSGEILDKILDARLTVQDSRTLK